MKNPRPLMSKTQNICLVILWFLFALLALIMVREIKQQKNLEQDSIYQSIALDNNLVLDNFQKINFNNLAKETLKKIATNNLKDLTKEEKLIIALNNETIACQETKEYSITELNTLVNKYFLNTTIKKGDIKDNNYTFKFNNDLVQVTNNCLSNYTLLTKLIEASLNKEYLKLELKLIYKEKRIEDNNEVFYYYNDLEEKELKEKLFLVDEDKVNWDNYSNYTFIFKNVEDNYYLEEVRK